MANCTGKTVHYSLLVFMDMTVNMGYAMYVIMEVFRISHVRLSLFIFEILSFSIICRKPPGGILIY
jgi:hypothetical protein